MGKIERERKKGNGKEREKKMGKIERKKWEK